MKETITTDESIVNVYDGDKIVKMTRREVRTIVTDKEVVTNKE